MIGHVAPLQSDLNRTFYSDLECLRGLAALMVAVAHSYIAVTFGGIDRLWEQPIGEVGQGSALIVRLILVAANGKAAVTLFFVLSGVVLGLSLDSYTAGAFASYRYFVIRRLFRIYPAHVVVLLAIFLVIAACGVVNPRDFVNASAWYNWFYLTEPDAVLVLKNACLWDISLNPVTWTLQVEMVVALFFPLLHRISRLNAGGVLSHLSMLALLISLALLFADNYFIANVYKFHIGLLIPVLLGMLDRRLPARGAMMGRKPGVIISVVIMLVLPQWLGDGGASDLLRSLGAGWLITVLMLPDGRGVFRSAILKKLGRYSYSFYLLHFPALWFSFYLLNQYPSTMGLIEAHTFAVAGVMCIATIAIAYYGAAACYRVIEKPFMNRGRRVAEFVAGSVHAGAHSR